MGIAYHLSNSNSSIELVQNDDATQFEIILIVYYSTANRC